MWLKPHSFFTWSLYFLNSSTGIPTPKLNEFLLFLLINSSSLVFSLSNCCYTPPPIFFLLEVGWEIMIGPQSPSDSYDHEQFWTEPARSWLNTWTFTSYLFLCYIYYTLPFLQVLKRVYKVLPFIFLPRRALWDKLGWVRLRVETWGFQS